jgi:two-component system phosphate regulon sensor histidine kinase PhoR
MLRAGFLWRLYAGYVALIVLLAVLVGVLIGRGTRTSSLDEIERSLRTDATILREMARPTLSALARGEPVPGDIPQVLASLPPEVETRLTVVLPDGRVLADSKEDPANMENHARRPEFMAARAAGEGQATRHSRTLGVDMMYLALPVMEHGEFLGLVRASLSLANVDARLGEVRTKVVLAAVISALVALLGGFFFARRITYPLRSLTAAAQSIAQGDYELPLRMANTGEIATLTAAFKTMREQLQEHVDTIEGDRNKILAILAAMKEGVVAIDASERIVHMNEAAGTTMGVEAAGCLGQRFWEVLRSPEACDLLDRTLKTAQGLQSEIRISGTVKDRHIELQTSVLVDAEGEMSGAVLVLHDVSELRRLEGIRSDFISNVSHELKTPVAAVRGLVESILDDPDMDEQTRTRFLERAETQSNRLSSIVSDLLSLSAIEARKELPRHPVALQAVVRQSIAGQVSEAEEKGLHLHAQLANAPITVLGETEDLRQVVDNLLSNAIRYTPEGGRIWVRLRAEDTRAVIEVEDTGIGIEPVHKERIFERFYRADKARSRELGGTGLGLAIVKHIVAGMGGTIEVDSVPSEGSTFRVIFPLAASTDV